MNQIEEKGPIPPEVFQLWKVRAEANEACEGLDIERLFVEEIERVAAIVNAIFPLGGPMELEFYMPGAKARGMSARENKQPI